MKIIELEVTSNICGELIIEVRGGIKEKITHFYKFKYFQRKEDKILLISLSIYSYNYILNHLFQ